MSDHAHPSPARLATFLGRVRRRTLWQAVARAGAHSVIGMLAQLLVLAFLASRMGPAGFWPGVTLLLLVGTALVILALELARSVWRLRSDSAAARWVGRLHPRVASDLISAVELAPRGQDPRFPRGGAGLAKEAALQPSLYAPSTALLAAFEDKVATELTALDLRVLLPRRPLARAAGVAAASLALFVLAAAIAKPLRMGLWTLVHRPSRYEGAVISPLPLVADIKVTYVYPPYTGLATRIIDGSTGDLVAVKGTRVLLEAHPVRRSRKAALLLGDNGESGELPARLEKGVLKTELTLNESGTYRFWLNPLIGRPVREQLTHRLTAEPDRPPRVDIAAAAEHLELERPRPIEIAYSADDDFGLGDIDLVYRVGSESEGREKLKDAHGLRSTQGRVLWDPGRLALFPGARVTYRIEARDQDAISGSKAGSSRTFTLVIQNPQQSLEERLDRQREILDRLLSALADRLEHQAEDQEQSNKAASAAWLEGRLAAYVSLHDTEESYLALLGRLLEDDKRDPHLGKPLRAALSGIADHLSDRLREERDLLASLRRSASASARKRWQLASERHVAELEKDVLLLDDLIGRQRLEDLASLGRDLTDAYRRLEDLLARYRATKDESLRRQLEREVRALKAQIADLAQKIAAVKSRNDVSEEWRNMPDTRRVLEQAKKFDELLAQGDPDALSRALGELGRDLDGLRKMLDQNAEGFGAERFPQENRVVADLVRKIGELEGDQRQLAGETQGLADKQEAAIERKLRDRMDELVKRIDEKTERLRQRLAAVPLGNPDGDLADHVNQAKEDAKRLRRSLKEKDLGEARTEIDRALAALDDALEEVENAPPPRKRKDNDNRERAAAALGEARAVADDIMKDIAGALPRGEETLSPDERGQAQGQAHKQQALGERAQELARDAARRLGRMPGLEDAEGDLRGAASDMQRASEHLGRSEAKQAQGAEKDAADRLAKLRDTLQERTMGTEGAGRQNRDPVRIPGADDSQAPRAWRQELMDAMKEKAPDRFRDDVRRYYEELVR